MDVNTHKSKLKVYSCSMLYSVRCSTEPKEQKRSLSKYLWTAQYTHTRKHTTVSILLIANCFWFSGLKGLLKIPSTRTWTRRWKWEQHMESLSWSEAFNMFCLDRLLVFLTVSTTVLFIQLEANVFTNGYSNEILQIPPGLKEGTWALIFT